MGDLKSLVSLVFTLCIMPIGYGCSSVAVTATKDAEQIEIGRTIDGSFEEPGQQTARLRFLLETKGKEISKTGDENYWYSTGQAKSRDQDYARQKAYERAVANMAGIVPVTVDRKDLVKVIEKTDETVTQDGSFWTAVVRVRVAKNKISALLGENVDAQKPLVELAAGVLTDSDFLYVYGRDTSADMQLALDKAEHAARLRLGSYLAGSDTFEREIVGSKTVNQNVARKDQFWVAEIVLKAPVALNKSDVTARDSGSQY